VIPFPNPIGLPDRVAVPTGQAGADFPGPNLPGPDGPVPA
jgi:hypothetical protein